MAARLNQAVFWYDHTAAEWRAHEFGPESAARVDPEISKAAGRVPLRVRELIRQIAMQYELTIASTSSYTFTYW
jgi:hypothetical protein